ncbi:MULTISPECIES: DNA adenine methylase [Dehalobacter]|jgi:DNA adenine methylase|uniref:DNA adenine methylase n=1 Tax=Dehalobacter TaxID=56112 RepID=UPI0002DEFA70|nr:MULTISPECIES: DNA adenine methylase [Dehalobacter]MCG1025986.1 DNA adenine methylase [Dehalobacter sp.]OCZ53188.1 DNA methyltransferase [Dehalobacter sp. TeCB1]
MVQFSSPLRYPGGKRKLAGFVKDAVIKNDIQGGTYVEPFAGGASVALYLLFNESVNQIIINDIDRSIYAFWYCVLNNTQELCSRIEQTAITMVEWENQKAVQQEKEQAEFLDLAFSTFFLNRTNRSGIIKGGVIGGKNQTGEWKMDVRFNKDDLIKRIEKIALYRDRISLHCSDSITFIDEILPDIDDHTLIYFDPPYYNQGSALYVNHYTHDNHVELSRYIQRLNCKWMLTYDYTPKIIEMYRDVEKRLLTLSYTASQKVKGSEMLAFSNNFIIPEGKYSAITIE